MEERGGSMVGLSGQEDDGVIPESESDEGGMGEGRKRVLPWE